MTREQIDAASRYSRFVVLMRWAMPAAAVLMLLLLLVCCLYTGGDWFLIAGVSVLFGMGLVFLPFALRALPLPEELAHRKVSLYVGIEQDGLGLRVTRCVFYEVKRAGVGAQRNAGGAQIGDSSKIASCPALLRGLIAMKLCCSARH